MPKSQTKSQPKTKIILSEEESADNKNVSDNAWAGEALNKE